jgi:hypothetical protein
MGDDIFETIIIQPISLFMIWKVLRTVDQVLYHRCDTLVPVPWAALAFTHSR